MSYDKLSLASFKEALKANKYANATGARRAVGKATTLSDADKDKARAAIDAHFGSAPAAPAAPKKAPAAKKAAAAAPKKVAAKKAAAAPKKQAAAAKPAAQPKKKAAASRQPRAAKPEQQAALPVQGVAHVGIDLENIGSIATQMRIAEKTIQNVAAALSVITHAKEKYPEAELGTAVEEMGGTLAGAVGIFRGVVNQITTNPTGTNLATTAPAPAVEPRQGVVNNGVGTSPAERLFRESGPEAAPVAQG